MLSDLLAAFFVVVAGAMLIPVTLSTRELIRVRRTMKTVQRTTDNGQPRDGRYMKLRGVARARRGAPLQTPLDHRPAAWWYVSAAADGHTWDYEPGTAMTVQTQKGTLLDVDAVEALLPPGQKETFDATSDPFVHPYADVTRRRAGGRPEGPVTLQQWAVAENDDVLIIGEVCDQPGRQIVTSARGRPLIVSRGTEGTLAGELAAAVDGLCRAALLAAVPAAGLISWASILAL